MSGSQSLPRSLPTSALLLGLLTALAAALVPAFSAAAPALAAGSPTVAAPLRGDVQDFSYDAWDVEYEISRDEDGRAVARVTETLTARFPDHDQNRGLVRGIPEDYEGGSTDPRDFRVTDGSGRAVPFEIERDGGFTAVLTGDDRYVHGVQTYVIEYTLSDVILARDDGAADEFYWDLSDFEHAQPIGRFTASISFAPELDARRTGEMRCYAGAARSSAECELAGDASAGSPIRIGPLPLGPREGVTVAIGLEPGSVVQPAARIPNFALDGLPVILAAAAVAASIAGTVAAAVLVRRRSIGRGIVVPQYEVPAQLPPLLAGAVVGRTATAVLAQLVHLALRGVTRIEESDEPGGLFSASKPRPRIRLVDPAAVGDPLDAEATRALFPSAQPGEVFVVPKRSTSFAGRMQKLGARGPAEAKKRGYFASERSRAGRLLGCLGLVLAVAAIALAALALAQRSGPWPVIALVLGALALILAIFAIVKHRVHTPLGAETREYLLGVRMFIEVAEQQRIEMLQSYEGAERRGDGSVDVIHLYEKLLPYAVLFGLEKQWAQVLQTRYEADPGYAPAWYPGAATHGMGGFSSTVSRFTASLSSSVSYTSSSSGGSSGGGFAGGGGGGGFSGGR